MVASYTTPPLHAARLMLSRFSLEDFPFIYEGWADNPLVNRWLLRPDHCTKENCRHDLLAVLQKYEHSSGYYHWAIRLDGVCIGAIALFCDSRNNSAQVAYLLQPSSWGQGFATEALQTVLQFGFECLRLNRISADHFAENLASGQVMKKAGMSREGYARQKYQKNDKFYDAVEYAILAQDWKKAPHGQA